MAMVFDVLRLMFSWLPSPLNVIFFGAFCIFAVIVLVKLIGAILHMIPFL